MEPSATIRVHNLPYEASEGDVLQVFRSYGQISKGGVRIARNYSTNISKGFGYVEFADTEAAQKAFAAAGRSEIAIFSRPTRVSYDHGRPKGSYRTGTGRQWSKDYREHNS